MKKLLLTMAAGAVLVMSSAFAKTESTPAAASVSAVCKDGTSYSGKSMRGACRGHGGVDKAATAKMKAEPKAAAGAATSAAAPAAEKAPAMGGGAGKVWVNNTSKVYHCQGDRFYGKTKNGAYMSEAEAKAKGFRPDHGKACK
ncbi:hypothetical protein PATSB16_28000 [Pandoraea thiooxydans]|uniref:Uncharacterized protein n=1 Tax=Pandoraea thiooxydans TaxID=445709 RepID=A0A0G3ENY2_9BURK|nr:hypothetical protein [Pandoraea thiooxydans]AKJ68700.1 hypothetical protein ABW99_11225 [Pandoraea thiooxydans]APR96140.1 hypothetical protein PATSB16_28000 [Pandoraea thiooxydans]